MLALCVVLFSVNISTSDSKTSPKEDAKPLVTPSQKKDDPKRPVGPSMKDLLEAPPDSQAAMWWYQLFLGNVERANEILKPTGAKLVVSPDGMNPLAPPRRITLEVLRGKTTNDELLVIDCIKVDGIGFVTCTESNFPKNGLKYFESYAYSIVKFSFSRCALAEGFFSRGATFKQMYYLHLDCTAVNSGHCDDIAKIKNLQDLTITNSDLADDDAIRLLKAELLHHLDLSGNTKITDKFASKLAESKITDADLSGTKLTSASTDSLLKCKSLSRLTISKSVFTREDIDKLKKNSVRVTEK